ncbi:MAG TPA: protein kinase [Ktedonobacteraceae bacterium]|nr:protein kinase [Ktedonobacteraceae bacterium]
MRGNTRHYMTRNGSFTISQRNGNGQRNTPTGNLGKQTILHRRYLILQTIGQGGMGAVYKAQDMSNRALVAIKEMGLSNVPQQERAQITHNFKVEASILARLDHPNLPRFHEQFSEGQRHFLVMEYIEGQTLEDLLEHNGPFPERRVLNWARQLCDVLEYLHGQRPPIIFRDMKPGNIMLTTRGRVKLIDFGIARFFRTSSSQDTQLLGTPGFAPPEQYGKAQTDERSDIYSLAMTLYQLMTNRLSEKGFGLKNVHAENPQISPAVARALEKATALAPEERYQDVAEFRRALLGPNTFVFDSGAQATTPEELAELCARYPREAADYLFASELEAWLREVGENDLARATKRIRSSALDEEEAVEEFLQLVMGPQAHTRSYAARATGGGTSQNTGTTRTSRPGFPLPGRFRRSTSSVIVTPRAIDFGQVYPGVSAPVTLSITGDRGLLVRGTISASEPWIRVDATSFDAMSTHVNVRVDSTGLHSSTPYTGTITIAPEGENESIEVKVQVDVLSYDQFVLGDDLEGDDTTTIGAGGTLMAPQVQAVKSAGGAGSTGSSRSVAATGNIPLSSPKFNEYREKYGPPGSGGWEALQVKAGQLRWIQRGMTLFAALMAGSLFYNLVSPLAGPHGSILPPSPWFLLALIGIAPFAALGAALFEREGAPGLRELFNRFCAALAVALPALVAGVSLWHGLPTGIPSWLEALMALLVTAFAAAIGANPFISERILRGTTWLLKRATTFIIGSYALIGGLLGLGLAAGFPLNWFVLISIALGVATGLALVLRADYLMKHP